MVTELKITVKVIKEREGCIAVGSVVQVYKYNEVTDTYIGIWSSPYGTYSVCIPSEICEILKSKPKRNRN